MNKEWKDDDKINIISYLNKEEKALVEEGGNDNGLDMDMDGIVGGASRKTDITI